MNVGHVVRWLFLALGALWVAPGSATAQRSDEGAPFLLLPVGADAVAVGRAVTAMPGQESAFWNPAGLAANDEPRLVLFRADLGVAGVSTAASVLLPARRIGTLGVSHLLLDVGQQEYKDADGNLLGSISLRNHLGVVSTAARVAPGLDVGLNFKVAQFSLSCRGTCGGLQASSTSYALDAGIQAELSERSPFRLGVMVANLGPRLQMENASQADPLPTRIRVALAYDYLRRLGRQDLQGWLAVELQDRARGAGEPSLYVGSELAAGLDQALFLRAGYAADADQPGGVSVGFGARFDQFEISVAKSPAYSTLSDSGDPVTVSFSLAF